ncbi:beta-aspartyl-peptidase (threonine type) [Devosia sp. UYZn731]|uniref:isoaspartyl peptidase/L-asparaginase family protein n=1 Tax=Devosia sp. UYZn731 TaxID=3156345 RepID=UPI00339819EB
MTRPVIAIHGGCGVMAKLDLSGADWADARHGLGEALLAGWRTLNEGGSAVDAVEAAIVIMEDSPQFNAGHGAALNAGGIHELDASIMRGADLGAGAVTLVRRIRNPIRAARALLEQGSPVMLGGPEADNFAARSGLDMVEQSYFTTERRVASLASLKAKALEGTLKSASEAEKHGTVGAVALDIAGHLAAGTSTGGYNNKPEGRIGDSPIIGAGTYARDGVCAVSGTGAGEFFIRHAVGHEIASRIAYLGESLAAAAAYVIKSDLASYGIGAGIVAVDAQGNITAPFNTDGMFRGWIDADGNLFVGTHADVSSVLL